MTPESNLDKIADVLFRAIEELNQRLPREQQLEKSPDTVLMGESSGLDSLALVHLIVAMEQKLQAAFNVPLTLADEKALSEKNSPFRTIGTLRDYIGAQLSEKVSA